jgi:ribosomal protein S4E
MLETVIPDVGSRVMVVRGENTGKIGKVLEKTKEKGEKRVIVQLFSDLSVHSLDLDSLSHYNGVQQDE